MDLGDWIAASAAGVALAAAIIALVVATYSKRQAVAAESQAQAAHDQVVLLRRQVEMAEEDHHEQNAPRFAIKWSPSFGADSAWFTLVYTAGPPRLDKVTVAVVSDSEVEGLCVHEREQRGRSSIDLMSVSGGVGRKFIALLNVNSDSGVVFHVGAETDRAAWEPVVVTAAEEY